MAILYLRKEPTTDPNVLTGRRVWDSMQRDVVAYEDAEATKERVRWNWLTRPKPTRHTKRLTLERKLFDVVWLPDLPVR